MPDIGSRANDSIVRSQHAATFDDPSRDWELVLRETGPLQGTGSRILEGLARSIRARLHGEAGQGGTRVTIVMPAAA